MAKWKCEVCGNEFENFHAQGFDNKIYCPLCYFKKENQELKLELSGYRQAILEDKDMLGLKEESEELNQKYLNAVADYETTMSELQELKKENKILRKNAEHNDKVVDKVNWENMLLKKENKELKKQLEEYENEPLTNKISRIDCVVSNIYSRNKTQQKEFINYLEDEIKFYKNRDTYMVVDIHGSYDLNNIELELLEEILQKYKEIIGDDK